jgi:hypothetical protein
MVHHSSTSEPTAGSKTEVKGKGKRIILDYILVPPLPYRVKVVRGLFLIVYQQDELWAYQ